MAGILRYAPGYASNLYFSDRISYFLHRRKYLRTIPEERFSKTHRQVFIFLSYTTFIFFSYITSNNEY